MVPRAWGQQWAQPPRGDRARVRTEDTGVKELLSLEPGGGHVGSHTQAGTGRSTVLCLSLRIIYSLINYCENLKINELGSRGSLGTMMPCR